MVVYMLLSAHTDFNFFNCLGVQGHLHRCSVTNKENTKHYNSCKLRLSKSNFPSTVMLFVVWIRNQNMLVV